MELPSTYKLHQMSERRETFECPMSDKELKWQQIRSIITQIQRATTEGEYEVYYWFPKELLNNKKLLKSVAKFFDDKNYKVTYSTQTRSDAECIIISWSDEFYLYNK